LRLHDNHRDQVVDDAFAALAYLRSRSDIDGSRIAVVGFSYGASAALRTSSATYRRGIDGFKAPSPSTRCA